MYVGLFAAIRSKRWVKVHKFVVNDFQFPGFLTTVINYKTGESAIWFLWDGEENLNVGRDLDEKYMSLEFLVTYSPDLIEERIISGEKPYEKLIKNNKLE